MIVDAFFIRKNMMKLRLGTKEIMKKKLIDHALKSEEKGQMYMLIIPLRRSRLSGKTETICPDRRKPLNLLLCAAKPHVCYCA